MFPAGVKNFCIISFSFVIFLQRELFDTNSRMSEMNCAQCTSFHFVFGPHILCGARLFFVHHIWSNWMLYFWPNRGRFAPLTNLSTRRRKHQALRPYLKSKLPTEKETRNPRAFARSPLPVDEREKFLCLRTLSKSERFLQTISNEHALQTEHNSVVILFLSFPTWFRNVKKQHNRCRFPHPGTSAHSSENLQKSCSKPALLRRRLDDQQLFFFFPNAGSNFGSKNVLWETAVVIHNGLRFWDVQTSSSNSSW